MEYVGIFFVHWVHFTAICYILWPFGIFVTVLLCFRKKNLVTLLLGGRCYDHFLPFLTSFREKIGRSSKKKKFNDQIFAKTDKNLKACVLEKWFCIVLQMRKDIK
jgi:hypothetical protein